MYPFTLKGTIFKVATVSKREAYDVRNTLIGAIIKMLPSFFLYIYHLFLIFLCHKGCGHFFKKFCYPPSLIFLYQL